MSDLFDEPTGPDRNASGQPLAARMRPRSLEEFVGQEHLLAPGRLLRRAIEADRLGSIVLYGPPGCGKRQVVMSVILNAWRLGIGLIL